MDKTKEKNILKMVYRDDRIYEVIDGENPDFKLKNKFQDTYFGIEVTELYYSDSSARLENVKGYFKEIMNKRRFLHKRDIKKLAVQKMTLIKPDGKSKEEIEGILQEFPSIENYIKMIIDVIVKKDEKIPDYSQGLTHVNLVILDSDYRLLTIPRSDFYNIVFTKSFVDVLRNSRFGEIFFITALEKDGNNLVYIPLKILLFVSQLYLFNSVLVHHYKNLEFESINEELMLFAYYLHCMGTKDIYTSEIEGHFQLICGRYGVTISDNREVKIYDFSDYSLPKNAVPIVFQDKNSLIDDDFILKYNEAFENRKFNNYLVFDVNNIDNQTSSDNIRYTKLYYRFNKKEK